MLVELTPTGQDHMFQSVYDKIERTGGWGVYTLLRYAFQSVHAKIERNYLEVSVGSAETVTSLREGWVLYDRRLRVRRNCAQTSQVSSEALSASGKQDATPFRSATDKVNSIVSLISSLEAPSFLAIGTWNLTAVNRLEQLSFQCTQAALPLDLVP